MAGSNVREFGKATEIATQRSLLERSSGLSIRHPVRVARVVIYYFGVCRGDVITRLAIADVIGHGETVSEISQYVYEALKAHM